jgi:arylsulfatase A-like enzyme
MLAASAAIGGTLWASGGRSSARAQDAPARKPNIVFILADDLGYGDLGCYGQTQVQTPNLDRMAAEGMRFTDAYSGSTVCAPSRCALMTGLHTGHCRVRGNALVPLLPEDVTVAETLKPAGYATGLVGKWGLGEPETTGVPNRKGFDEFFGYLNQQHAHNSYPDYLWRNETKEPLEGNVVNEKRYCTRCTQFSNDLFTREALSFLDRHQREPFFLYLAYTIPHANNEMGSATGNGMEVPSDEPYTDRPWPQPQKNHAAMITRLDRDVGAVLQRIKDLGLDDDTIVFFSSDNGPHKEGGAKPEFFQSSGSLRGIKRDLYDGGIRVPMLARWPGRIAAGSTSNLPWAFWDFLPTAAELAGAPIPPGLDGLSVTPALLGKLQDQPQREYLYWEFHEGGFKQAVRLGNWKVVRPGTEAPIEVYEVTTDLNEQHNVADQHPDLVKRAEELFKSARTDSTEWPVRRKEST